MYNIPDNFDNGEETRYHYKYVSDVNVQDGYHILRNCNDERIVSIKLTYKNIEIYSPEKKNLPH